MTMTLTWDNESDAGYLDTARPGPSQPVARSAPIHDQDSRLYGALDLAADGTLLGIEILGVSTLLPSTNS
ncbi:MAG TPA: DUF2283 domain-containing protein [Pseudonocardia sp.]